MDKSIKILVVEDELLLAEDIRIQLSQLGYVVYVVHDYESALEKLSILKIDLIMLDIRLNGEKDGIDIASYIVENHHLPFIFLSSLTDPEYVERAKKVYPYAYLIKPFNLREVQIAIEVALVNFSRDHRQTSMSEPKIEKELILPIASSIFLKHKDRFERVSFSEILYLEASSNYTTIFTNHSNYVYSNLLKSFEDRLPRNLFMRVHRSFIVNIEKVDSFEGNSIFVKGKRIPVSQAHRPIVFQRLNTL